MRRRKYAHRITNATTTTAPREAPIAAAMTVFFEVLPVEPPALSSDDFCVDDGSVLEAVIAGKSVAAAALMASRHQPWLFLASTEG